MPKISELPETTSLVNTHLIQVVDTAKAPSVANEKITAANLAKSLSASGYMFNNELTDQYSLTTSPVDLTTWATDAGVTGSSMLIADGVNGTFTTDATMGAGVYKVESSIVYETITVGNDNDFILFVDVDGVNDAITTSYMANTGKQDYLSMFASKYVTLGNASVVKLQLACTADASGNFHSRSFTIQRIS